MAWTFGTYTRALADTYFASSTDKDLWDAFSEELRSNAVTQAERQIWAFYGGYHLLQDPDDIDQYSRIRQDYAIYEQAIFILQKTGSIPNGEGSTPKWMANSEDSDAQAKSTDDAYPVQIAPKAKFWLGRNVINPRICIG